MENHARTTIGYETLLTRHFHGYPPPRPLAEIDAEIRSLKEKIQRLLREVTAFVKAPSFVNGFRPARRSWAYIPTSNATVEWALTALKSCTDC